MKNLTPDMLSEGKNICRLFRKGDKVPESWWTYEGEKPNITFGCDVVVSFEKDQYIVKQLRLSDCLINVENMKGPTTVHPLMKVLFIGRDFQCWWEPDQKEIENEIK